MLALFNAARELREKQLVVRKIQPSTVMFSSDFGKVIFADLKYLIQNGEEDECELPLNFPYNSCPFYDLVHLPAACHERDLWAIGMLILEIFVGTEFLQHGLEYNWVKCVWNASKHYIEEPLRDLLEWLLYGTKEISYRTFVCKHLQANSTLVLESIHKIRAAFTDDMPLGQLWDNFLMSRGDSDLEPEQSKNQF